MNIQERFRQSLGRELSSISSDLKRQGSVWTCPLDDDQTYAVMLEFSDTRFIPKTVSVYCGVYRKGLKPIQDLSAQKWKYVTFPYKIHHQLFQIPGAHWFKKSTGHLYWILLMQQKKMHINNKEQIKYSEEVLLPYAAKQATEIYKNMQTNLARIDNRIKYTNDLR